MLFMAGDFVRTRTATSARRLFFASIIYLPLLLGALVAFRL
jgi:heme O synthase-like polyprenyltransferase